MSLARVLYVSKFHARYRRVEYALNASETRFRHASDRYMRVPIIRNIAAVTCPKCVKGARLKFDARL